MNQNTSCPSSQRVQLSHLLWLVDYLLHLQHLTMCLVPPDLLIQNSIMSTVRRVSTPGQEALVFYTLNLCSDRSSLKKSKKSVSGRYFRTPLSKNPMTVDHMQDMCSTHASLATRGLLISERRLKLIR